MTSRLVIYHKNCADGFAAAFAAWLEFGDVDTEYLPAHYGDPAPDVGGKEVYIVDFSYKRAELIQMNEAAESLIVLDHHKTAQAELEGLRFCEFNMEKSGAVLAWEYFHPGLEIPALFEYIQDRDLWQWRLPQSKEFSAGLRMMPMVFEDWSELIYAYKMLEVKKTGAVVLEYEQKLVEDVVSNPVGEAVIGGYRVPCVNTTTLISEIGNRLAVGNPFAAMYFETDEKRIYSLRSEENGVDVSEIAKMYGGGGHPRAAGFTVPKPQIEFPIIT